MCTVSVISITRRESSGKRTSERTGERKGNESKMIKGRTEMSESKRLRLAVNQFPRVSLVINNT